MIFDAISAQLDIVAEAARRTKAARRSMQRSFEARRDVLPAVAELDDAHSNPNPANPNPANPNPANPNPANPDPADLPRSGPPVLPFEVEEWS